MPATQNELTAFLLKAAQARFMSLAGDLNPAEYEAQPIPGVNSVAWMLGHLTVVDRRILGLLGAELPPVPDGFADRFKTTKQPAGEQKGLGDPKELLALFEKHRTLLIETVEKADAATLDKPLPTPVGAAKTVGEAAAFMAIHATLHGGQISVIRRALGYPPVV